MSGQSYSPTPTNNNICICGKELVSGYGSTKPRILVLIDYADADEQKAGVMCIGRVGALLKREFAMAGIGPLEYRVEAYWKHYMPKRTADQRTDCTNLMITRAVESMQTVQYVLLCGSEISKMFYGGYVSRHSGLEIHSKSLPEGPVYYAMINPSGGLAIPIGEIRLPIQKFARRIKDDTSANIRNR